ncbi:MAG: 30S ribosomal protein S18 [Chitinivibrionales bacterium]|nr:30S ribosomal protein S18 [Chitinivibrionales bacterium]MBD3397148.1 30S ribosomal protein S18 [Chitinivibrionales bacterium]
MPPRGRPGKGRGRGRSSRKFRGRRARKVCVFCETKTEPDYKATEAIGRMITDRGKIVPRRISGLCAKHQRRVATEIKRARHLALLPFVAENIR